jgi:hypothetical protein
MFIFLLKRLVQNKSSSFVCNVLHMYGGWIVITSYVTTFNVITSYADVGLELNNYGNNYLTATKFTTSYLMTLRACYVMLCCDV